MGLSFEEHIIRAVRHIGQGLAGARSIEFKDLAGSDELLVRIVEFKDSSIGVVGGLIDTVRRECLYDERACARMDECIDESSSARQGKGILSHPTRSLRAGIEGSEERKEHDASRIDSAIRCRESY